METVEELYHARIDNNVQRLLNGYRHFFEFKFPIVSEIDGEAFNEIAFEALYDDIVFGDEQIEVLNSNGSISHIITHIRMKLIPYKYWKEYSALSGSRDKNANKYELIVSVFDIEYVTIRDHGSSEKIKWI